MSVEVLVHFDPKLPIKLTTDASAYGVGAVLSHIMTNGNDRPIAYSSRTLNNAERNYAQIEKEGSSVIFGLSKFNQYLFGKEFILVTDHKPLLTIFSPNKGIPQFSANRLRRWAIILSNYQYKIQFVKSQKNLADCLSRLPIKDKEKWDNFDLNYMNYFYYNEDMPIDFDAVKQFIQKDEVSSKVKMYILKGWHKSIKNNNLIKPYFNYRHELSLDNGCLLWNNRLVVPNKLKQRFLDQLHKTHLAVVKMKSVARSYVWWPNINKDIENLAKSCENCNIHKRNPPKIPLNNWKWANNPWNRIHIDYVDHFLINISS